MSGTGAGPAGEPEPRWHFFISYTAADRPWAEWVAWSLEEAGYRVFFQAWDFVAGSHWTTRMREGITGAEHTLAILSPAYLSSVYGQAEWQAAYRADPQGFTRRLIPVRVEDCDRPDVLGEVVSFDLFGLTADDARRHLLDTISHAVNGRAKPEVPPAFPSPTPPAAPREGEPAFPGPVAALETGEAGEAGGGVRLALPAPHAAPTPADAPTPATQLPAVGWVPDVREGQPRDDARPDPPAIDKPTPATPTPATPTTPDPPAADIPTTPDPPAQRPSRISRLLRWPTLVAAAVLLVVVTATALTVSSATGRDPNPTGTTVGLSTPAAAAPHTHRRLPAPALPRTSWVPR